MSYFKTVKTMDELKAEYRRLALENHPDKGGNVETMQEINADFEIRYRVLKLRSPQNAPAAETATSFRKQFYTQNGWSGSRYDMQAFPLKKLQKSSGGMSRTFTLHGGSVLQLIMLPCVRNYRFPLWKARWTYLTRKRFGRKPG